VRTTAAISLAFLAIIFLTAQATAPDDLLQRGRDEYHAAHYAEAVTDLTAAADAFLSPEQVQAYVTSGKIPSLDKFETAVIYLAMAYAKLGKNTEAAEQVRRLLAAEAIAPTYRKLVLPSDVEGFETLAMRIAPSTPIPPKGSAPIPGPQVAQAPAPAPAPAPGQPAIEQRVAEARTAAQSEADQRVAAARTAAEQEAQQRIAAERAAIQKAADEKIAAEREAIRKEADRVIAEARAAAEKEMQEKIDAERASARKAMEERIAADRAAIEKQTQERIAAERVNVAKEVAEESRRNLIAALRQAELQASKGNIEEANNTYVRVLSAPDASRETVAAVATGLYRTGDFTDALRAFQRLGTFGRGEEDLRYYKAVALYEIGRYDEAKKELACALPYLQMSDEVLRYRAKIEQTNR
jgi:hypothetical protein